MLAMVLLAQVIARAPLTLMCVLLQYSAVLFLLLLVLCVVVTAPQ